MHDPLLDDDDVDARIRAGAGKLPEQERSWPALAACCGLGAVTVGAGADLIGYGQWAIPGALALGATCVATTTLGLRRKNRDKTIDRAVEKLYAPLGWPRPGRELLEVHSWVKARGGSPARFRLYYNGAGLTVLDEWLPSLKKSVNRLGWGQMEIAHHDERECAIDFRPAVAAVDEDHDVETRRVKRTAKALFGPGSRVHDVEFTELGELAAFHVDHEISHKLAPSGYRARLEKVVSATFHGRWRARWKLEEDTVRFELRPALPKSLWNQELELPDGEDLKNNYDKTEITYALDEDGQVHVWRPAINPHFLLVGTTGSGKTATGHHIMVEFSRHGWPIWVADGKCIEFLPFQDWPSVQVVGTSLPENVAIIHRAWELMEYRYSKVVSGEATSNDFEPLLLVIDEFADFKAGLLNWYPEVKIKGDPSKPAVLSEVGSLSRKARTARIHILLTTQRPDADILTGEARDNYRQRYSIGRLSPAGAGMMWESEAIGTTIPAGLRGRGISMSELGHPVEVQGFRIPDPAKTTDPDELARLERLRPAESKHPRLLVMAPDASEATLQAKAGTGNAAKENLENPEFVASVEPSYQDWCRTEWVLAEDYPHLDPVKKRQLRAETGRRDPFAGSTLAIFDLPDPEGNDPGDEHLAPVVQLPTRSQLSEMSDSEAGDAIGDQWIGYEPPRTLPASQIRLGDLVCVDEGSDEWVAVDTDPEEDFDDPDELLVTWRGVGDSEGTLGLAPGEYVLVRKPEKEMEPV